MKSLPDIIRSRRRVIRLRFLLLTYVCEWFEREVSFLVRTTALDGLLAICADMPLDEKDRVTLYRRGLYEENFLTKLLPAFGKQFDRALALGYFSPVDQFRSERGFPIFLRSLTRGIFDSEGMLRTDACPRSVRFVRQICFYAYKLDLPYAAESTAAVVEGFIATERELWDILPGFNGYGGVLNEHTDPDQRKVPTHPATATASILVQALFASFNADSLVPKHGPGVTATKELSQKWSAPISPGSPTDPRLTTKYWWDADHSLSRTNQFPTMGTSSYFRPERGEIAKVILVPKDSRGPRLISCEPAERQFFQQGIKDQMVSILEKHPMTRGHVNFTDQTINQELAVRASKDQYWATLDLKDASDRVSFDLVDTLFGGTELSQLIKTVRSPYTQLPSGELLRLRKYAPMGSALCFPCLATSVWAISCAYLYGILGNLSEACSLVYVYGDDLVVPSQYAFGVIDALESYGLKVNRDKSFINSRFAESCGTDAFDGVNVTPVRLRSLFCLFGDGFGQAKAMVSIVAHARELEKSGFHAAAEGYYSFAEQFIGALPYATDTSPYLGRFCLPEDWSILHNEWMERNYGKRKRNFVGIIVKSTEVVNADDGPLEHLYRTHMTWGSGESLPKIGHYDQPRRLRLLKRKFRANHPELNVYGIPEWVKESKDL
jgi:hypothetical protein